MKTEIRSQNFFTQFELVTDGAKDYKKVQHLEGKCNGRASII